MKKTLLLYLPENSVPLVVYLIEKYAINLKIVNERQTKHGDFRTFANGQTQITVNNNLNKHQFLLTLIHEIAHHVTYTKFGRVQPHGQEWKTVFQHLMIPFLRPDIYPNHILPLLANHFKNPKASTDSDPKLALALKGNTASHGKHFIFEIPEGKIFLYKKNTYKMGKKRRTRYECLNLSTKKTYLFNQNMEVLLIE